MFEDYFAPIASKYDQWYREPLGNYIDQLETSLVMSLLAPQAGETIADVGAGTGRFAAQLASIGVNVVAIEPSGPMRNIGIQTTRDLSVRWINSTAEHIALADNSVDAAVAITVLEFVSYPEIVISEMKRIVRPQGRLILGVLNALSPWAALYRYLGDLDIPPWPHAKLKSREDIGRLLGIESEEVKGCVHLAPDARPPFDEADKAGVRAGNQPAFLVAKKEVT